MNKPIFKNLMWGAPSMWGAWSSCTICTMVNPALLVTQQCLLNLLLVSLYLNRNTIPDL